MPSAADAGVLLAGLAPPGEGNAPATKQFTVVLDPGSHLFRAARAGHQAALVRRTYRPGEHAALDLRLDVLPATVSLKSEPAAGIVRVDDREVGLAPIEFQRKAGHYKLEVVLDDYETYTTELELRAGERADSTAESCPTRRRSTRPGGFGPRPQPWSAQE